MISLALSRICYLYGLCTASYEEKYGRVPSMRQVLSYRYGKREPLCIGRTAELSQFSICIVFWGRCPPEACMHTSTPVYLSRVYGFTANRTMEEKAFSIVSFCLRGVPRLVTIKYRWIALKSRKARKQSHEGTTIRPLGVRIRDKNYREP